MSRNNSELVSLEQAKLLVEYLETGEQAKADVLISEIQSKNHSQLLSEISDLTIKLQHAMQNVHLDSRLNNLAQEEIPDAKERLNFVIQKTEEAANKTMDAAESIFPIIDNIKQQLDIIHPMWEKLVEGDITVDLFKDMCCFIDGLLYSLNDQAQHTSQQITEIIMAQGFQDLTGQVIGKVIELVREVESNLTEILTSYDAETDNQPKAKKVGKNLVEGPIINSENRSDSVSDQDGVDDLLSNLGL